MFERSKMPLIPRTAFIKRLLIYLFYGFLTVLLFILAGMIGFHFIEKTTWLDSFFLASTFFAGIGSEVPIITGWGKFFASFYALICPFVLVTSITILLLPILHRLLHRFHIEKEKK